MKYQFNTRTDKLSGARKKKSHQRKPLLQIAHNHKLIPSNNANTGTDMCTTRLLNKMGQFFKENVFLYKIPNVTSSQLEFASDRPIGCRANYTVMQSAQKIILQFCQHFCSHGAYQFRKVLVNWPLKHIITMRFH